MQPSHSPLPAAGIVAIVLVVAGVFWVVLSGIPERKEIVGPAVEERVTKTAAVVANEPLQLEQSVQVFVANFYAAYADADAERMASYFTLDRRGEDIGTYQQLFFGGEATRLFVAPNASEKVSGHEVVKAEELAVGWRLVIREQRIDATGGDLPAVTTTMTLLPSSLASGSWLIASYARDGKDGTYEALTTNP
jgi:hypothetical protein